MIAALKAFDTTAKVIFGLLALCIVLSLAMAIFTMRSAKHDARKADAGQTMAEGRTGAAQDASAIRDRADERTSEIDATVKDGTDAIRHAPDRASANAAALRSLCRIDPSRDARCRVLLADPGKVG